MPAPIIEPVPARLEQCLHFNLGDAFEVSYGATTEISIPRAALAGYHTFRRCDLVMSGHVHAFAVFFEPTGLTRIFGTPLQYLMDQDHVARDVLGGRIDALWERLADARQFAERVRVLEAFLLSEVGRRRSAASFSGAAEYLIARRGMVRMDQMALDMGFSRRQLERVFRAETGCAPKRYARVARFQAALDMKLAGPQRSWLEIAHHLSYHDQMHMVHDFEALSRYSPDRLLSELGEGRPRALITSAT